MHLPDIINLGFFQFSTIYIFGVLGVAASSFIVWVLGKKDGFTEFKLLDLFVITSVITAVLFLFTKVGPYAFILGAILPIFIFCRYWKWSVFRVLDVFSLSWSLFAFVYYFGQFLIHTKVLDLVFSFTFFVSLITFTKLRDRSLKSGIIFSFFVCTGVLLGVAINRSLPNLIFYLILVTLSTVNLYFRFKRDMPNNNLPEGLLKFFKDKLVSKEKRLNREQTQLQEEDPYLKSDRAIGNSEELDEAILEDQRKEDFDRQKASVNSMQVLVRKALARVKIGKYGICEVCNQPIETARLKAFPEATTCIKHSK